MALEGIRAVTALGGVCYLLPHFFLDMSEIQVYKVPSEWKKRAHIDAEGYAKMYAQSVRDPEGFWAEQGKRIDWFKPYTKVKDVSFAYPDVSIRWFHDGVTNAAYNCIDRHLETRGDQVAILWEGDDPGRRQEDHLSRAARAGLPLRQCPEGPRASRRATG
jgi:hypothetical protein